MTNLTLQQIIPLCAGAAALIIAVSLYLTNRSQKRKNGTLGLKKLASVLRRFAGIRSYKVINNIDLPLSDGRYAHIDHILVGFFGVMVLDNRPELGAVYGEARDKEWISVISAKNGTERRKKFPNPVTLNQERCEAVRSVMQQNRIYRVNIESYVVFTDRKVQLGTQPNLPVMTLKKFKKFLSHSRYSENGPVDVMQVTKAIQAAAIQK